MNSQYINLVRELPPPTDEQIALFATYVSEAHSWYKHLPVSARVPFYFYLDPNAGRSYYKIIHYTAQPIEEYRRRFGFWTYDCGSTKLPIFPQTTPETSVASKVILSVYDSQAKPHVVPPALADLGKAYLSALVHPHATGFGFVLAVSRMKDGRLRSVLERESAHLVSTTPEFLRHIWVILQKLQADFPITNNPVIKGEIPAILKSSQSSLERTHPNSAERQPEMTEPVQKTLEFLEALGAEWRRTRLDYNYSWRGDEWLTEQTKALGGTTTFVTLLQALEIARTSDTLCSVLVFNIERLVETEQQKVSLDFIAEFHHAFVSERIRQLEDMKRAMYRFVEAVYHPHAPVTYLVPPADQEKCTLQHEKEVLSQKVAIQEQLAMHYEQGKQHYWAGRYQEALVNFELVLRYRSDFSPALYRIACIYALQGKVKPAVAYFKKLLLSVLTIENWRE
jgi:hypothetical protein